MKSSIDSSAQGRVPSNAVAAEVVSLPKPRAQNVVGLSAISNDPYERDMVKFAISWRCYGGGSAGQIFEEFGLVEQEFFRRVFLLIKTPAANLVLGQALAQQLAQTCLSRLGNCYPRPSKPA